MQDVRSVSTALSFYLYSLNVQVKNINIINVKGVEFILSFSTNKGDYAVPFSFSGNVNEKYIMKNLITNNNTELNSLADSLIDAVIINLVTAGDLSPIELFVTALAKYWDYVFVYTSAPMELRAAHAMNELRSVIYLNPLAEAEPRKYINNPHFMKEFISGPSGNRIYYSLGMHTRSDIRSIRQGETF